MWVFIFQRSEKEELARETGEEHMVPPLASGLCVGRFCVAPCLDLSPCLQCPKSVRSAMPGVGPISLFPSLLEPFVEMAEAPEENALEQRLIHSHY